MQQLTLPDWLRSMGIIDANNDLSQGQGTAAGNPSSIPGVSLRRYMPTPGFGSDIPNPFAPQQPPAPFDPNRPLLRTALPSMQIQLADALSPQRGPAADPMADPAADPEPPGFDSAPSTATMAPAQQKSLPGWAKAFLLTAGLGAIKSAQGGNMSPLALLTEAGRGYLSGQEQRAARQRQAMEDQRKWSQDEIDSQNERARTLEAWTRSKLMQKEIEGIDRQRAQGPADQSPAQPPAGGPTPAQGLAGSPSPTLAPAGALTPTQGPADGSTSIQAYAADPVRLKMGVWQYAPATQQTLAQYSGANPRRGMWNAAGTGRTQASYNGPTAGPDRNARLNATLTQAQGATPSPSGLPRVRGAYALTAPYAPPLPATRPMPVQPPPGMSPQGTPRSGGMAVRDQFTRQIPAGVTGITVDPQTGILYKNGVPQKKRWK